MTLQTELRRSDLLNISYKYVTLRHYRSRCLPVKEYMEKNGLKFVSPVVCNDCLLELYQGRPHEELTGKEKSIEKSISVLNLR